jgi:A/G-specific adenine glycosylase
MDEIQKAQFQSTVWQFYEAHGRHVLPWRLTSADGTFDPYKILVSEVMLQQTQVPRVVPKYLEFLNQFPTVDALAVTPLRAVLKVWNGLGYNRRAKFLLGAAQAIKRDHNGVFPTELKQLISLPGVGINTAGAILAYAYNQPVVFIETNIRTVFIHHFFSDATAVEDKAIAALVAETVDARNPREWYWALMDYGSSLKDSVGNKSQASKSYTKQSRFAGSNRQLRGAIIRALLKRPCTAVELGYELPDERLSNILAQLVREGLITEVNGHFSIT